MLYDHNDKRVPADLDSDQVFKEFFPGLRDEFSEWEMCLDENYTYTVVKTDGSEESDECYCVDLNKDGVYVNILNDLDSEAQRELWFGVSLKDPNIEVRGWSFSAAGFLNLYSLYEELNKQIYVAYKIKELLG